MWAKGDVGELDTRKIEHHTISRGTATYVGEIAARIPSTHGFYLGSWDKQVTTPISWKMLGDNASPIAGAQETVPSVIFLLALEVHQDGVVLGRPHHERHSLRSKRSKTGRQRAFKGEFQHPEPIAIERQNTVYTAVTMVVGEELSCQNTTNPQPPPPNKNGEYGGDPDPTCLPVHRATGFSIAGGGMSTCSPASPR